MATHTVDFIARSSVMSFQTNREISDMQCQSTDIIPSKPRRAAAQFKSLRIDNTFAPDEVAQGFATIDKAGIVCLSHNDVLVFKFDAVDVRLLEQAADANAVVASVLEQLQKIRSFSSSNGKAECFNRRFE